MYVIVKLLSCIPETDIILSINYASIKKELNFQKLRKKRMLEYQRQQSPSATTSEKREAWAPSQGLATHLPLRLSGENRCGSRFLLSL